MTVTQRRLAHQQLMTTRFGRKCVYCGLFWPTPDAIGHFADMLDGVRASKAVKSTNDIAARVIDVAR